MAAGRGTRHPAGGDDPIGHGGRQRASPTPPFSRARLFDRILSTRSIQTVYQPIVDLVSREVLAFEALTRGPKGSPLERPDVLFATARDLGLVRELDWVCRAKAMEHAMESGLGSGLTLFIKVEPDVAASRAPDDLQLILKQADRDLRVVLEVSDRALLQRPAELVDYLSWARDRWWGVALDGVGADADSLALMPFASPDVIKFDFRFVRQAVLTDVDRRVVDAVNTQAARTGATILAEGIEKSSHLARAAEIGATLGQGWYFGRPTALPKTLPTPTRAVPLLARTPKTIHSGPWAILESMSIDHRQMAGPDARRVFGGVEQNATTSREAPIVLAAFPAGAGPWGDVAERMARLSTHTAFCGAVGEGLARHTIEGWQTMSLEADDEMADEWCLAIVGPHHSEAVVAYDAGSRDRDGQGLWNVATTRDRDAAIAVADHLLRRLGTPIVAHEGRRNR